MCGVGIVSGNRSTIDLETKDHTKEYKLWSSLLNRCYSKSRIKPCYVGCTVSDNFLRFDYFAEWCNNQVGFGLDGWQLDKDIVLPRNKIYSEDVCVFIPQEINSLLTIHKSNKGKYPVGVSENRGRYRAGMSIFGKFTTLGVYKSPELASFAYKCAKELQVKIVAEKYKNVVDSRVYDALMKWDLTDTHETTTQA